MKKYHKKPVVVEAEQWFKLGDVPEANIEPIGNNIEFICGVCGKTAQEHGIIQTLEGSHIVCPGDYIIKGIKGEFYPCKPDIFKETYEEVNE